MNPSYFDKLSSKDVKKWFKYGIYFAFCVLYFGDHPFYQILATKINRDLITPYRQTYNVELVATPTQELLPTIVETIFQIDPTLTPRPRIIITKAPIIATVSISEDDLWAALTTYRHTHGRKEINRVDSLCKYARKRAQELIDRLSSHPDDPLDSHAGFSRDADNGSVFTETGFNNIGENLAYTPSFTSATQIIEWGWDSSSGHRSLQLSNDISHGCITGIHPIYVGIFGS